MPRLRATTILAVRTSAGAALGGDGQVTLGNIVMKNDAKKIRRLFDGKVLAGFGSGALGNHLARARQVAERPPSLDAYRVAREIARRARYVPAVV